MEVIPLVYIASPYTLPEPIANTRRAIDAFNVLADAGYTPFVPHLTLLCQLVEPREPEWWYAHDLELLARCDILLRLPGESWGADQEVEFCRENGILVFKGTAEEFVKWEGERL